MPPRGGRQRHIPPNVSCKENLHLTHSIPGLCQRTSKSFAARPCNRPVAAKHMLFCPPRLQHIDNLIIL